MSQNDLVRIELEAAKALIEWKALFAEEVCQHAQRLAASSNQPHLITAAQYRQAAQVALNSLAAAILGGDERNAHRAAA